MSNMLSQDEINALLSGGKALTHLQKDIIGEIGNISIGTAATTLFSLLNQKVTITSPEVVISELSKLSERYEKPCVGVRIDYTNGLEGSNTLVLKYSDVKIITDLMMGGDGSTVVYGDLTEIDLSAIGEAMNQMIGSSSTSLATFIKEKIDIDIPRPFVVSEDDELTPGNFGLDTEEPVVIVFFKLSIGELSNSTMMQIMPIEFAHELSNKLIKRFGYEDPEMVQAKEKQAKVTQAEAGEAAVEVEEIQQQADEPAQAAGVTEEQAEALESQNEPAEEETNFGDGYTNMVNSEREAPPMPEAPPQSQVNNSIREDLINMDTTTMTQQGSGTESKIQQDVNAQPAQFQDFDRSTITAHKENIDLLMDVPLDVTVELGKTTKTIKEILEFAPGTIIELDKLAGEPIDILVNGKYVAKGEVVVIDENFAIRVTSIVSAELRI